MAERFVVAAQAPQGSAVRVYGPWRSVAPARRFAQRLIENGLEAHVAVLEAATITNARRFFGAGEADRTRTDTDAR